MRSRTPPISSRDLRFCESSISASLEVWRKYLYTIFLQLVDAVVGRDDSGCGYFLQEAGEQL